MSLNLQENRMMPACLRTLISLALLWSVKILYSNSAPKTNKIKQFASLGGFLFGYDQGVVSGVLTMESFGASFPKVYADPGFKGWWVSTILLS
jgi:hypothetical protein